MPNNNRLNRLVVTLLAVSAVGGLIYWQIPDEGTPQLASNLLVFTVVNLTIVVICILAFLIGRNVVKLVFDRQRNILGSKLRMRLVVAFVSLTLVPTVILFMLASGLLTSAMEGWISNQVETSLTGAVEVAKQHFATFRESTQRSAETIVQGLQRRLRSNGDMGEEKQWLEDQRVAYGLYSLRIIGKERDEIVRVQNAAAAIETFSEPPLEEDALTRGLGGERAVVFAERGSAQYVRVYLPVRGAGRQLVLVTTSRINPELSQAIASVNDSYKDYQNLKFFKNPVKSGYLLTLAMITGLILFSAIWFGFYMAREITTPIQRLAEGTREIAKGNYDFEIPAPGDDEIGVLVRSFNTMIADLKHSRAEAERRRVYLETLLANLAIGVIGVDHRKTVISVNSAAAALCALHEPAAALGKKLDAVLEQALFDQIRPLLDGIEDRDGVPGSEGDAALVAEGELRIPAQGRELKVVCTVGKVLDHNGAWLGTVLLFDDITDLSIAQHMSAWREVARRIAHEIKNPLTPIQLSAQRLLKWAAGGTAPAGSPVNEATQTIIENVDSIKRLANEFSNFARMPTADFESGDLNQLISDVVAPFAEIHTEIAFHFIADSKLPAVLMDREQLRRMLMNLLDNAIAALLREESASDEGRRVVLKTRYNRRAQRVSIEVSDNGPGITESDKARIFEPYFTTKKEGTGLGLAIVTSIVADHQGSIRVYDNQPHGATFIIDFPITPKVTTQRRFAVSDAPPTQG